MSTLPLHQSPPLYRSNSQEYHNGSQTSVSPLPAHAGLWLDRCYYVPPGKSDQKEDRSISDTRHFHFEQTIQSLKPGTPAVTHYHPFYKKWCKQTDEQTNCPPELIREVVELEAVSPIVLHQGSGTVAMETSILLHHTYGVPYLPGSALKGLLRHYGEQYLDLPNAEQAIDALLGYSPEQKNSSQQQKKSMNHEAGTAGFINFNDALWIPPSNGDRQMSNFSPLMHDILTPHFGRYLQADEKNRPAPDGRQNPVPVPFLAITPGTRFRLLLECWCGTGQCLTPWLDWAQKTLLIILAEYGIGAKSNAGYGVVTEVGKASTKGRLSGPAGDSSNALDTDSKPYHGQARLLSFKKNGALYTRVTFEDKTAEPQTPELAKEILEGLPADIQQRLRKKGKSKPFMVNVSLQYKTIGKNYFVEKLEVIK